jgi:Zn-dependent membrane protease YugP
VVSLAITFVELIKVLRDKPSQETLELLHNLFAGATVDDNLCWIYSVAPSLLTYGAKLVSGKILLSYAADIFSYC